MRLTFVLRWPPSVNHLTSVVNGRKILSRNGRSFRDTEVNCIRQTAAGSRISGALAVSITAYPPDRRIRDLDNLLKMPLDCLKKAGVIDDDSKVEQLSIKRGPVRNGGFLVIEIHGLEISETASSIGALSVVKSTSTEQES